MQLKRFLVLQDRGVLGRPEGTDRFVVHPEFWFQLCSICGSESFKAGSVVLDFESMGMADLLEAKLSDESWQIHLSLWGDENGKVVRELSGFFRGGGFVVIESAI